MSKAPACQRPPTLLHVTFVAAVQGTCPLATPVMTFMTFTPKGVKCVTTMVSGHMCIYWKKAYHTSVSEGGYPVPMLEMGYHTAAARNKHKATHGYGMGREGRIHSYTMGRGGANPFTA